MSVTYKCPDCAVTFVEGSTAARDLELWRHIMIAHILVDDAKPSRLARQYVEAQNDLYYPLLRILIVGPHVLQT